MNKDVKELLKALGKFILCVIFLIGLIVAVIYLFR